MARALPLVALLAGCTLITGEPRSPGLVQPSFDFGHATDGAACTDTLDDPRNCGACGHDCTALPSVIPSLAVCFAGHCDVSLACRPGRAHCSLREDDGCETDLSLPTSCGACGSVCSGALSLCNSSGGTFSCAPACTGATPDRCGDACIDLATNSAHCGTCATVCPGTACIAGKCAGMCAPGLHMCPPGGCVSDSSVASCGTSCTPCAPPANGSAICKAGLCDFTCNAGYARLGTTCVRSDFTAQTSGATVNLNAVSARSSVEVFAVGSGGVILRSAGDGTWLADSSPTTQRLNNVYADSSSVLYAVGGMGTILALDDNTQTWGALTSNTVENLFGLGGGATLYAAGTHGALDVSSDAGHAAWTVQTLGSENEHSVWQSADASATYVVGQSGFIRFSSGAGFSQQTSGVATYLNGVWGSSKTDVYIVGQSGVILHSTGNGTWTAQTSGVPNTLWWIWGANDHDLYVVGDQGVVLHSPGGGAWAPLASGVTSALYAVSGSSSSDVYVVGQSGVILHRP